MELVQRHPSSITFIAAGLISLCSSGALTWVGSLFEDAAMDSVTQLLRSPRLLAQYCASGNLCVLGVPVGEALTEATARMFV